MILRCGYIFALIRGATNSFVEIYTIEWSTDVGLCRLCVTSLLQFAGFIYFVLVESTIILSSEYEDRRSS